MANPKKVENLLSLIIYPIYLIAHFLLYNIWIVGRGFLKFFGLLGVGMVLFLIYVFSTPVSIFGRFSLSRWATHIFLRLVNEDRMSEIRHEMVQEMLVNWEGPPELDNKAEYQDKIQTVRQNAIDNIERGETFLSIIFGLVIFIVSIWDHPLPAYSIFRVSISVVEAYLFFISIAILYRVSFLEILAINEDVEFDTLEEWDVAVTLQEGICELNSVKISMIMISLRYVFSDKQFRTAFQLLSELNSGDLPKSVGATLSRGWNLHRENNERED